MIDLTEHFRGHLAQIIEPRIEELYSLIAEIVQDSGFEELVSSGIVMTGERQCCKELLNWGKIFFSTSKNSHSEV